ncbi:MAG: hypothetical protein EAZ97_05035 [Bacteroidetes bacterium]|nr:MAG: hypothetical protein EAZ97_05035 [Bacteroidota bacterium]
MTTIKASPLATAIYGYTSASVQSWSNYGYALLIIAGADGEVSESEMAWLLNVHEKMLEAPGEVIEALHSFDFKNHSLEMVLHKISFDVPINYKRTLIYDAIKMAHADLFYAPAEQKAVHQAAILLGVPSEVTCALEQIVNMEMAADKMRRFLLHIEQVSQEKTSTLESEIVDSISLYVMQADGFSREATRLLADYGKALLTIAGSDGEVSEQEWEWIKNYFKIIDESGEDALEMMEEFDYKNANLAEILSKIDAKNELPNCRSSLKRTLLYNAIQVAKADDDYSEKETVEKASKLLGIPKNEVLLIESLVSTEIAIDKMRKTIFDM